MIWAVMTGQRAHRGLRGGLIVVIVLTALVPGAVALATPSISTAGKTVGPIGFIRSCHQPAPGQGPPCEGVPCTQRPPRAKALPVRAGNLVRIHASARTRRVVVQLRRGSCGPIGTVLRARRDGTSHKYWHVRVPHTHRATFIRVRLVYKTQHEIAVFGMRTLPDR